MKMELHVSPETYDTIHSYVEIGLFKTDEQVIQNLSLMLAEQKVKQYQQDSKEFEKKWKMKFEEFEKKVKKSKDEVFEEWDDYVIWSGINEELKKWQKILKKLRSKGLSA